MTIVEERRMNLPFPFGEGAERGEADEVMHSSVLLKVNLCGTILTSSVSFAATCLASARSRSGSDSTPYCHSIPSRRFATQGGRVIHPSASLPKGEGDRRQVRFALLLSGVSAYKVTLGGKIENFSKEKLLTLLRVYSKIEVYKNRRESIYVKFINNAS